MRTVIRVLRWCRSSRCGDSALLLICLAAATLTAGCSGDLSPLAASTSSSTASATPTSLAGRVVDASTAAGIASSQVTLVDSSGNVMTATTDASGAFVFDNVTAGTCSLQVAAAGYGVSVSTMSFPVSSYTVRLRHDGPSPTVTIVSVTVSGPASMVVGRSSQFTATALYTDGSSQDVSTVAKWSSTTFPSIVSISTSGLVTAYLAGSTAVTAAFDNTTGSLPIVITSR